MVAWLAAIDFLFYGIYLVTHPPDPLPLGNL